MRSLVVIFTLVVVLGVAEVLYISHSIDNLVKQPVQADVAQECPVWLADRPQEGCRGR